MAQRFPALVLNEVLSHCIQVHGVWTHLADLPMLKVR